MAFLSGVQLVTLSDIMLWVPVVTLLLCVPYVCYMDWKYREVPHKFWIFLLAFNIPVYCAMILNGVYEGWMLGVSAFAVIIYFVMMKQGLIEGADFVFMMWIAVFLVISPMTGVGGLAGSFSIMLIACTVASTFITKTINLVSKTRAMDTCMFPMMFPISAALILTVILV